LNASKELGNAAGNRARALQMQQVSHALHPAVRNLWEPGVQQLVAIHKQLMRLRAQRGEHRLGDVCGLVGAELPRGEGW